jgi:hypothetical protein
MSWQLGLGLWFAGLGAFCWACMAIGAFMTAYKPRRLRHPHPMATRKHSPFQEWQK